MTNEPKMCDAMPNPKAVMRVGTNSKGGSMVVPMSYVTQQALAASKLTLDEWNAITDDQREAHMIKAAAAIQAADG